MEGAYNEPRPVYWSGLSLYSVSIHAEMAIIIKLLKKYKIYPKKDKRKFPARKTPDTIFVIRNYKNKLTNSRPCNHCIKIMKYYNIKYVVYSNSFGGFTKEKIKNMKLDHISKGNKRLF